MGKPQHHQASGRAYGVAYSLFCTLLPLSLCLFATGGALSDYALAFWGVMALFCANVIYGFLRLRDRLLFLFLHFGIALFLLSRPFISVVCNRPDWWLLSSPETTMFALNALYLSMFCLLAATGLCGSVLSLNASARSRAHAELPNKLMGSVSAGAHGGAVGACGPDGARSGAIDGARGAATSGAAGVRGAGSAPSAHAARERGGNGVLRTLAATTGKVQRSDKVRYLRAVSLFCFVVCVLGAFYAGSLKLTYMSGRVYTDFYLADTSSYTPWVIGLMEAMVPFMLSAYLATMPRRRGAVLCLVAYVATTLPMLMIGSRSDFVIAFLFAALYFVFRAVTDKEEVWISRRLVIACCIAAPLGIAAMGIMDYLRAGADTDLDFAGLVVDALYKQGVSFTILGRAYDVNDQIQQLGFRFFSMGGLIDTFTQGFIGQTFFGFTQLPTTNSYELATQGWSYAHAMSFYAHDNYLGGEGYGSSYILELFADFGYGGIAVGSLVLGAGLFALSRGLGRSWFWGMCALTAATHVFHMPRGYYDEWLSYLWSTRFLLALGAIIVLSAGLYFLQKHVLAARGRKILQGNNAFHSMKTPDELPVLSECKASWARVPACNRVLEEACRAVRVGVCPETGAQLALGAQPASETQLEVRAAGQSGMPQTGAQPRANKGARKDNSDLRGRAQAHGGACGRTFSRNAYNVAVLAGATAER